MIELIEEDVQTLIKLHSNLKKSIYKRFKTETLEAKLQYVVALYNDIETNLIEKEEHIPESKFKFLIKVSREAFYEIKQIIKQKLQENLQFEPKRSTVTMAPPVAPEAAPKPFDIKTATALINTYDGSPSELDAFVDSVSLLSDLTDQEHIATAIKFIKTRLIGKARSAFPPNPQTLVDITNAIKQACKSVETPDSILAKMKATRNKGDQQKFCEEIETLSQKLPTLYIENQIPPNVANKMATKAGVDTLINGVSNTELKIILKANEFDSIQKAIKKINESQSEQSQVFSFQSRGRGRGNNSQTSNFYRSRSYPNNDSNRPYRNYYQNQNRRGNGRGQNNFRGNFRGNRGRNPSYTTNNSNQHRTGHGHNVFYSQSENGPVPQQMIVGGIVSNQPQTTQMQPSPQQIHSRR